MEKMFPGFGSMWPRAIFLKSHGQQHFGFGGENRTTCGLLLVLVWGWNSLHKILEQRRLKSWIRPGKQIQHIVTWGQIDRRLWRQYPLSKLFPFHKQFNSKIHWSQCYHLLPVLAFLGPRSTFAHLWSMFYPLAWEVFPIVVVEQISVCLRSPAPSTTCVPETSYFSFYPDLVEESDSVQLCQHWTQKHVHTKAKLKIRIANSAARTFLQKCSTNSNAFCAYVCVTRKSSLFYK